MNATRVGAGARTRLYASTTATYDPVLGIDYIAVECALNGEPVTLTTREKICAARILDHRGFTLREISARVHADPSTIRGWKTNGWKPGPHPKSRTRREAPNTGRPISKHRSVPESQPEGTAA